MKASTFFSILFLFTMPALNCQDNKKSTDISEETNLFSEKLVGGPFENGEFYKIGMPKSIPSIDTSDGWSQKGQRLLITGTIYKSDGKTLASDVILYYYHTNTEGVYANRYDLDQRVVRHGYIRSWVKSDKKGRYSIYTVRPAPYANRVIPAHIHPAIKESRIENAYYIDDFVFDDDVLLTSKIRQRNENRGGSGVLRLVRDGDLMVAEHNIFLGLNIPTIPIVKQYQVRQTK